MITINTTSGVQAVISDEDEFVSRFTWFPQPINKTEVALKRQWRGYYKGSEMLPRVIMARMIGRKLTRSEIVKHKDGNRLNCQRDNLVLTTRKEMSC